MIRLCLFDLDQTLVDTSDMQELREAGKHRTDNAYPQEVRTAFLSRQRNLIDEVTLLALTLNNAGLKIGVFTRSPRRYVDVVLAEAYVLIQWDAVIAYEDVQNRKPNAEGIYRAMQAVGMNDTSALPHVLMVGDSDVDIRAAYHAGCYAALFKQGWPQTYEKTHWRSMGLLPDSILDDQSELQACIANPTPALPDLECLLEGEQAIATPRYDEIGKFFPDERTRHVVSTAGRSFADYRSLDQRRAWHRLSQSIQQHKESVQFPNEWIQTVQRFIANHYRMIAGFPIGPGPELVITCIPPRPDRVHRLGYFVNQLAASYGNAPLVNRLRLTFDHGLLAYRPGVRSQSQDHLSPAERFANVRDHLYVINPDAARGRKFLVIDDVTTTGATLLYAKKYLMAAGATSVDCFSIAQNISDPLRLQ
ncbi:HAD-IA family hydrolase [Pseudoxanthomonas sp.]|uniref:HAD-IA family hydrolase n=1 Tax=Pseudoxanthomonas sp. TaxID=1871049 RepID=UPI0025D29FF3|nr:HAD-IA family hydrolase [Pseudoxanthomonas sp.]